jgi:hypothetical protein
MKTNGLTTLSPVMCALMSMRYKYPRRFHALLGGMRPTQPDLVERHVDDMATAAVEDLSAAFHVETGMTWYCFSGTPDDWRMFELSRIEDMPIEQYNEPAHKVYERVDKIRDALRTGFFQPSTFLAPFLNLHYSEKTNISRIAKTCHERMVRLIFKGVSIFGGSLSQLGSNRPSPEQGILVVRAFFF